MKFIIIVSEKRTDINYSPGKETSSSQDEENATTVQNDQLTLSIRVWYHDVIICECFISLENAQKSPRTTTRVTSAKAKGTPYSF